MVPRWCVAVARELSKRSGMPERFAAIPSPPPPFHSRATCFLARSQKRRARALQFPPCSLGLVHEGPSNHLTDHSSRRGSRTSHTLCVNVSRNWHRLPVIVPHPCLFSSLIPFTHCQAPVSALFPH